MVLGQQGHRSTYPCPFCKANGREGFLDGHEAELRTFGFNRKNAKRFQEHNKMPAKACFNVVNDPVLEAEDDDYQAPPLGQEATNTFSDKKEPERENTGERSQ